MKDSAALIDKLKTLNDFETRFSDKLLSYICCVDQQIKDIFFRSVKPETVNTNFLSPYNGIIRDFAVRLVFRIAAEVSENSLNLVVKSKDAVQEDLEHWFTANHQTVGRVAAV